MDPAGEDESNVGVIPVLEAAFRSLEMDSWVVRGREQATRGHGSKAVESSVAGKSRH